MSTAYPSSIDSFSVLTDRGTIIAPSSYTVSATAPYTVTTLYPILSGVTIPGYTEVTGTPATPTQFRVLYRTNKIEFAATAAGASVSVTYVTLGSVISSSLINNLQDSVVAIETELGANVKNTYTDLKERIDAMQTTTGHTHEPGEDLTTQIPVTSDQVSFTVLNTPVASSMTLFLNGVEIHPNDFAVSGSDITLIIAPTYGDTLVAAYQKI
jgi:hypothetical protein